MSTTTAEQTVRAMRPDLDPTASKGQARSFRMLVRLVAVVQECDALRKGGAKDAVKILAARHGVEEPTVRSWLHRAKQHGLEPSPPPRIGKVQVPPDLFDDLVAIAAHVSAGRQAAFAQQRPYPDAKARRVLGALVETGLVKSDPVTDADTAEG